MHHCKVRSIGVCFIIFILCLMLVSPSILVLTCVLCKEVNQLVTDLFFFFFGTLPVMGVFSEVILLNVNLHKFHLLSVKY